ncbi:sulfurtransferase TusA family protein [Jonesia quinghaiensis]|uniref:sulfurtransferase TusA family protein n=1 Tax=Jonesia quinghaiensis TaxID=262806 RepID=UPI00040ADB02|nr:sulfurtransferase TusA family protein [Jonesia quinghaiensis]
MIECDATGLRCPLPVIRLARLIQEGPPGAQVRVIASDPAAEYDIPAWARMKGHTCSAPNYTTEPHWSVSFVVTATGV